MEIISNVFGGFLSLLNFYSLMWIFIGSLVGTIIGMLPGLGPATGIAVLIPITFGMDPSVALSTMVAIYLGAMFGGSRASILLNTPGTASAIASAFDGYPMSKQGRAGEALAISAWASFIGGVISSILFPFVIEPLSTLAIKFGPPQYTMLMLFALIAISTISDAPFIKSLLSSLFGIMLATVGADYLTGTTRFTFGLLELYQGVNFFVLIIGLYTLGEVFSNSHSIFLGQKNSAQEDMHLSKVKLTKKEFKKCLFPMLRSTPLGFIIGILPGAGAAIATMSCYAAEKKMAKPQEKKTFGKGNIVGLAAPEAANNSAATGAIIPLLSLGIPGSGTTAVMLGALTMLGVRPGPLFLSQQSDVAWALIASMFVVNIILIIINLPLATQLVKILKLPIQILFPCIIVLGFIGVYLLTFSSLALATLIIFGIMAYLFKSFNLPITNFILAFILSEKLETSFRQSMNISQNNFSVFVSEPITIFFTVAISLSILFPVAKMFIKKVSQRALIKTS